MVDNRLTPQKFCFVLFYIYGGISTENICCTWRRLDDGSYPIHGRKKGLGRGFSILDDSLKASIQIVEIERKALHMSNCVIYIRRRVTTYL